MSTHLNGREIYSAPFLKQKALFAFFLISAFLFFKMPAVLALTSQELKDQISGRAAALDDLKKQRQQVEKNLEELGGKNRTLQSELKKIDYQINQLNLNIRAGEVALEKLDLEVESLESEIGGIEKNIGGKKEAIAQALRDLQQKDEENFLMAMLKHKSLAVGIAESQALIDLNGGLSESILTLKNLQTDLAVKIDDVAKKKFQKEKETRNLKNRQSITLGQKEERQELLKQTKNQEKLYQQQLTDLEKKQAEIAAEITDIEEELRLKLDPTLLPVARPGVLAMPVENGNGRVTQKFGTVSRLYGGKPHNGLDLGASFGTVITAAEGGKVIMVADQDKFCPRSAYGKMVLIEHENNLTTLYAHLSRFIVKESDIINRGDLIGYSGRTGYATGPHLHFGVYASQTVTIRQSRTCGRMPFGAPLNPQDYL